MGASSKQVRHGCFGLRLARRMAEGLALLAISAGACAAADSEPAALARATQVVERLHNALAGIADSADESLDARFRAIQQVISETHDFRDMSRFLLRREWADLSGKQRRMFEERFIVLSTSQYASRFARLGRDSTEIVGVEMASSTRAYVHASLTDADGDEVPLSYTLQRTADAWRIANVVANGVSDLALRRAEYSSLLRNEGFEVLMEHLDEQIAALD